jgi:hypothetical protein
MGTLDIPSTLTSIVRKKRRQREGRELEGLIMTREYYFVFCG